MEDSTPTWAKWVAGILVFLGIIASFAMSALFVWALVKVVTWLVTK